MISAAVWPVMAQCTLFCTVWKNADARRLGGVVIDAGGVDVRNLLIEAALAGADVLNAASQLIEIIEGLIRVFQALVIQHKALDDILAQPLRRPDAKARRHRAFHPVAHRQNHVEVIKRHVARHRSRALRANLSEIPTACRLLQLALVVDMLNMLHHIGARGLEQLRHLLLGQPQGFILQPRFHLQATVLGLVDQHLASRSR
jgi:hypothetical protein